LQNTYTKGSTFFRCCAWNFQLKKTHLYMHKSACLLLVSSAILLLSIASCSNDKPAEQVAEVKPDNPAKADFGGFESQVKWGEHLVTIGGCNDCHTPKKFGPQGMMPNDSLKLSGHVAGSPLPKIDRKMLQQNHLFASNDMTVYLGPWGVSYAANLTPDSTGIGAWKEEQFITAIRKGITKGLPGSRPMLPPMPWPGVAQIDSTDQEYSSCAFAPGKLGSAHTNGPA
jgi:hypothetical protein